MLVKWFYVNNDFSNILQSKFPKLLDRLNSLKPIYQLNQFFQNKLSSDKISHLIKKMSNLDHLRLGKLF